MRRPRIDFGNLIKEIAQDINKHYKSIIAVGLFCLFWLLEYYVFTFDWFWGFLAAIITTATIVLALQYYKTQTMGLKAKVCFTLILASFLIIGHALGVALVTDSIYTNGQISFSSYPTYVNIRVEEPLSVDHATFMTLVALESINQTFGYRMVLNDVTVFEDDGFDKYDAKSNPGYERAKLRLNSRLNKRVDVTISFLHGEGPDIDAWGGNCSAAGTSNGGGDIRLYFSEPTELYFNNINHTLYKIKTILHEFGHSFGLPHNTESPIMFTTEKKDNPKNESRPELNLFVNTTEFTPFPQPKGNVSPGHLFETYIAPNMSYPLLFNQTYDIAINPHLKYYDYVLDNRQFRDMLYIQMTRTTVGNITHYRIMQYHVNMSDFSNCWLPEELAACKA